MDIMETIRDQVEKQLNYSLYERLAQSAAVWIFFSHSTGLDGLRAAFCLCGYSI